MERSIIGKSLAVFCLLAYCGAAFSAEPNVTLQKDPSGVKVLIGDDVFTVYRFGADRRKPFFYPVAAAGGYELLKQAVQTDPADAETRKVVVVAEKVTAGGEDFPFGTVLSVAKVEGNKVLIDGKNAWLNRSDIMPVASIVTRLINDDPNAGKDRKSPQFYDHPHHKGIWFGVDEINGIKFWMEDSLVVARKVEIVSASGKTASFKVVSDWLDKEDQPVLEQETLITIGNDQLISYDATLKASAENVHIGDTKEGFFAVRLAPSMAEKLAKGPVTNAEGEVGTPKLWGTTSRWMNYVGPVFDKKYAATIMDSSTNPWPSRYHVRDYSLFSVNPFGDGAYTEKSDNPQPKHARDLKKGDSLRFHYGLWLHDGDVPAEGIEKAYARFVGLGGSK